jgi:hypothetical protein
MSAYGPTAGHEAGQIARAIRDGFARVSKGEQVQVYRMGERLDADGLRAWFRDKIDGMINLKAGLRSDGAPKRVGHCRCKACLHQHGHDLKRGGLVNVRCPSCPVPHRDYGRKWEYDYQASAWRDSRRARERVTRRVVVQQFETEDARRRLGHLLSTWED